LNQIAMARIKSDGGVERFAAALGDKKTCVNATKTLGAAGPLARDATDALLASVKGGNDFAVTALLSIGADRAAIVDAVNVMLQDQHEIKYQTGQDIVELYPESKALIPRLVEMGQGASSISARQMKVWARTLNELDPQWPDVERALFEQLESSQTGDRVWAARFLSQIELPPEKVLPLLRELLTDPEPSVRVAAADSLYELGEPADELLPTLLAALQPPSAATSRAMLVLQKMGPAAQEAVPQLEHLAQHGKGDVIRKRAAETLKAIRGR
jgi:hypothetical protein